MDQNNPTKPEMTSEEEAKLIRMAARRTSFKIHLAIFILTNAFLWVVWYFLFMGKEDHTFLKAIVFLLIVWLLAVILHYMIVYKWTKSYKEKELSSLKKIRMRQLQEIEELKAEMGQKEEPDNENTGDDQENTETEEKNSRLID